jgi:hypothetical protein
MNEIDGQSRNNGLAKTALGLGIAAIVTAVALIGGLIGVAAVVVGAVALRRPGERGKATAGIVTGAVAIGLATVAGLVIAVGIVSRVRAHATATLSMLHLRQLSQGLELYCVENRDHLPPTLDQIGALMQGHGDALLDARLHGPSHPSTGSVPWPDQTPVPCDFYYAGAGLKMSMMRPASDHIVIYDKPQPGQPRLLAFADGHVGALRPSSPELGDVVRTTNADRQQANLPPLPLDLAGPPPMPDAPAPTP